MTGKSEIHELKQWNHPPRPGRLDGGERGAGGVDDLLEGDRCRAARRHGGHEGGDLRPVSLVLPPGPEGPEPLEAMPRRDPEVLHPEDPAAAEDLQRLLGVAAGAVGEVVDRPHRAVGEGQEDRHLVLPDGRRAAHHRRRDARHRRLCQKGQQVDEVAPLADDPPAAPFRVLGPVVRRNEAGVDRHRHGQRLRPARQQFPHFYRVGAEAPVEPRHDHGGQVFKISVFPRSAGKR